MNVTKEQIESIRRGAPMRLQEEGTDLVILRADVFDRMSDLVYDGGPWTDEEMEMLAAEDADYLGWEGMEAYEEDES